MNKYILSRVKMLFNNNYYVDSNYTFYEYVSQDGTLKIRFKSKHPLSLWKCFVVVKPSDLNSLYDGVIFINGVHHQIADNVLTQFVESMYIDYNPFVIQKCMTTMSIEELKDYWK